MSMRLLYLFIPVNYLFLVGFALNNLDKIIQPIRKFLINMLVLKFDIEILLIYMSKKIDIYFIRFRNTF